MSWWPFRRKPTFAEDAMTRADQEIAKAVAHLQEGLAQAQQRATADYERVREIAEMPVNGVTWTPVVNRYGQILAIAWKDNIDTAVQLLEQPGEGWA